MASGLLEISSVSGASPNWQLTVSSVGAATIGDHVAAPKDGLPVGDGGVYRVLSVGAGVLNVTDDLVPGGGTFGKPGAGSAQFYTPTLNIKLSQCADSGPQWGAALRRDLGVVDAAIGGGGGGGATATTSWIQMAVDPTLGTSPPAGTVIRNQAEYDALGHDLLFAQDALDLLPPMLRHGVVVTLRAGTHAGKPGRTGTTGYDPWLFVPNFQVDTVEAYWEAGDGRPLGLYFEGEGATNIGAPVAGVWSGFDFTRDAGTWTTDAEAGRMFLVTEGFLAGSVFPIYGNSTTKIDMYFSLPSSETMTIQVFEPAAMVVPGAFPFVQQSVMSNCARVAGLGLQFKNIFFNDGEADLLWFGRIEFVECMYLGRGISLRHDTLTGSMLDDSSRLSFFVGSAIRFSDSGNGSQGGLRIAGGGVYFFVSTLRGYCYGVEGLYSLVNIFSDDWSTFGDCRIGPAYEAVPTIAGALIYLERGRIRAGWFANTNTVLEGNGLTTGVSLRGNGGLYAFSDSVPGLRVRNHNVAVRVASHSAIHASGFRPQSLGNVVGWQIDKGARVVSFDPQNVGASNAILIDGQVETYAALAAPGDSVIGPYGSELLRRA